MSQFLLLFMLLPQQLTWYEVYERGEKQFSSHQYEACIDDMEQAVSKKPTAGRNIFTRAVQKIDYKPYYYLALSYMEQGQLSKAFEHAQMAFDGDVVKTSPLLQADLSKILTAYKNMVEAEHERYTEEAAIINRRNQLITSLNDGRFREVAAFLDSTDNPDAYKDIRMYLSLRQKTESNLKTIRQNIIGRIHEYIAKADAEGAQSLLNGFRKELDSVTVGGLQAQINAIPEPIAEPEEVAIPSVTENDNADDAAAEEVARFSQLLSDAQAQVENLDGQVKGFKAQNEQLRQELAQKKKEPPKAFEPRIFLALSQTEMGLNISAHAISPMKLKAKELAYNGDSLNVSEELWENDGSDYSLNFTAADIAFGGNEVVFKVVDELGRKVETRQKLVISKPWYRELWFYSLLGIGLVLLIFALLLRNHIRKKKAKLKHFNPYIAGSPVRDIELFYGRDNLIQRIQGLVHKNSFMIHGNRRIGKTSMLLQLKRNLAELNPENYCFYPAFVDLQGIHEEELFHHMMAELLHQAEDWDISLEDLTFEDEGSRYQARQFSRDLKKIITRLKEKEQRHIMVVLLVDEVDVLNEFSEKTNQKLRGIFMKEFAEHLTCVMAGIHLKKEWESAGSPWYNFFEEIPVNPIDEKSARKLILDPVKGIFSYKGDSVARIIEATLCHPYLIQKVCVALIGEKLKEHKFNIYPKDVDATLEKLDEEFRRYL